VAAFSRNEETGALTQLPGTAACVSETGTGGACADGVALDQAFGVAVSPDGESVYVVTNISDAVAAFSRNEETGALTQLPGTAACVSKTGTGGACTVGVLLGDNIRVEVSPDGESVYVAVQISDVDAGGVAAFSRNGDTGALTQLPGTAACVSETGTGGACADGVALAGAFSVAVSRDGGSVYMASVISDAVAAFSRDEETGALTQLPGTAACVSETGTGGACADGVTLDGAIGVAVSRDGGSVYVVTNISDAVAAFSRNEGS
ncbi:MAG: hypothetical protein ACRDH5_15600, partial [bacterium]